MKGEIKNFTIIKILIFSIFSLFLLGCSRQECSQYGIFVQEGQERTELLQWADSQIFPRKFEPSELRIGNLVGPGRNAAISFEQTKIKLPAVLSESKYWASGHSPEVRILGSERSSPDAIFIGRKSYQGLIITKGELEATLTALNLSQEAYIYAKGDRVAIMCYSD